MTSSSVKSDDSTDEVLPLSVMLCIIESLVQHILEETDTPETDTPKHQCEFLTDPERGKCSFCEAWGTALPMVYPDVFQDTDE
jgi:hypothetical protein